MIEDNRERDGVESERQSKRLWGLSWTFLLGKREREENSHKQRDWFTRTKVLVWKASTAFLVRFIKVNRMRKSLALKI